MYALESSSAVAMYVCTLVAWHGRAIFKRYNGANLNKLPFARGGISSFLLVNILRFRLSFAELLPYILE